MKRAFLMMIAVFTLFVCGISAQVTHAEVNHYYGHVIGIAWRADVDSEFYTNIVRAIEEAGGQPVLLGQVKSKDLVYDANGKLIMGVDENGALDVNAGKLIRRNTWKGSNASDVIGDIDTVIFTGGEDISSSLFLKQVPWHGIEEEKDYNAERDVSDYLTMSYCLDNDISVVGFCRGMQMLAVISGAEMIQDIPTYYKSIGVEYHYAHRNNKATPDSYRDYAPHSVNIAENSLIYDIFDTKTLHGCPSWHHQAVENVRHTPLRVTATTEADGIEIIEAIERTDKTFAIGFQFHPEAAIVKHLNKKQNADSFMNYETAIRVFKRIVEQNETTLAEAA